MFNEKNILVMRHAQSLEDIDKNAYELVSDENMPLSAYGEKQAKDFGENILKLNPDLQDMLHIIVAPIERVIKTAEIIISSAPKNIKISFETENLIKKQDWGSVTIHNREKIEKERYEVGVFDYQFPDGENGKDLLLRFDKARKKIISKIQNEQITNTLILTHGFEMRVLLKSFFEWSEEYFTLLANPHNCEYKRISIVNGNKLKLLDEMRMYDKTLNNNYVSKIKIHD